MISPTAETRCRVRIVNDIQNRTAVIESRHDRSMVYAYLVKLVHQVNHRKDDTVRASLHAMQDVIVLHWHCPWVVGCDVASEILEIAEPLHEVVWMIMAGGPKK